MPSPLRFALFLLSLVALVALVEACDLSEQSCTLVACHDGVAVDFRYTEPGSYVVEVLVDGRLTTCRETIPLGTQVACDSEGVRLLTNGYALPAAEHAIEGLEISRTDVESLSVRVTRDGVEVAGATLSPDYVETPGPNGPHCDPERCRLARPTL